MNSVHSAWVGKKCNIHLKQLKGHWLYVRRCETPDPSGLVLPDWTHDYSLWNEVLAIGTEVAKPRKWSKTLLKERGVARCMEDYYRVGQIVLVPKNLPHWGIQHSPYANDEFFIDEACFICAVPGEVNDRLTG